MPASLKRIRSDMVQELQEANEDFNSAGDRAYKALNQLFGDLTSKADDIGRDNARFKGAATSIASKLDNISTALSRQAAETRASAASARSAATAATACAAATNKLSQQIKVVANKLRQSLDPPQLVESWSPVAHTSSWSSPDVETSDSS